MKSLSPSGNRTITMMKSSPPSGSRTRAMMKHCQLVVTYVDCDEQRLFKGKSIFAESHEI